MATNNTTQSSSNRTRLTFTLAAVVLMSVMAVPANSCPFCTAVNRTFAEQMGTSDVVVIAQLETKPESPSRIRLPRGTFSVVSIFKGSDQIEVGAEFETVVVSRKLQPGDKFLVMGTGNETINWTTPLKASEELIAYLENIESLPESGAERLAFFAKHFEHKESVIAYDAYDEFARAPYSDILQLEGKLDHDQLVAFISDSDVIKSRKRLYYTLLGVCGDEKDVPFLEDILKSSDRDRQAGLDACIACYLTIRGDDGMALIEELFLNNPDADWVDIFSSITAVRFHGTESSKVSREVVVRGLRHVLKRPKMADMVIADLTRWEDWTVMEELVELFKVCNNPETRWVRTPIISYLQVCPRPEATDFLAELRELDPKAAERADMMADLNWGDEDEDDWDDEDEKPEVKPEVSEPQPKSEVKPKSETKMKEADVGTIEEGTTKEGTKEKQETGKGGLSGPDIFDDGPVANSNEAASAYVSTNAASVVSGPNVGLDGVTGLTSQKNSDVATSVTAEAIRQADERSSKMAQRVNQETPVAAAPLPTSPSLFVMLLTSLAVCIGLLVLVWTVLNGSFERLIS